MEEVRLFERPALRNPVLIAAFAGWNDAAQSATSAVRFLLRRWSSQKFAEIDPEPFFDFTETRPTVRIVDGAVRRVEWPVSDLFYHRDDAQSRDYLLLVGVEPQLRWKSFVGGILSLSRELGTTTIVTVGALLAEVPHTVPARVLGFSNDAKLAARLRRLDAIPSQYEGPTGITGVLNAEAAEQGFETASIWGSVPTYLSAIPNPKVTLAILQRLGGLLDLDVPLHDIEEMSRQFDQQVADAVANNPQIASYVQQLEEREGGPVVETPVEPPAAPPSPPAGAADLPSGKSLVEDIEEFLRQLRKNGEGESS